MFDAAFKLGIIIAGANMLSGPVGAAQEQMKSLQKTVSITQEKMMAFTKVGVALAGVGLVTKKAFSASLREFTSFERGMGEVHTMLGATYEGFDKLEAGTRKVIAQGPHLQGETVRALYNILSAGIAASESLDVLALSSKAATAGATDINTAADIGTTILNSYGMPVSKLGEVFDQLFLIVKLGKTTFPELSQYLGEVTSIAAAAKVPFNELSAAMGLLTKMGVKTPEAVTAIKALIRDMASIDTQNVLRKIGGESLATAAKSGKLVDVMSTLAKLGYTELGKLQEVFPNIRSSLAGVIAALHPEELRKFNEMMQSSGGVMMESAGIMENTLGYQINRLRNNWGLFKEDVGRSIAPIVGWFVSGFIKMTEAVRKFADSHPLIFKFAMTITYATGTVAGLAGALVPLIVAVWFLVGPLGIVTGVLKSLHLVTRLASIAFNLFNLTLWSCPIIFIVAGILLVIWAIYKLVNILRTARKAQDDFNRTISEGALVGRQLTDTLTKGIAANANQPVNATRDMVEKMDKLLPHSPAKIGPLRNLGEVGMNFVNTIAEGIRSGADYLRDAASFALGATRRPAFAGAPAWVGGGQRVVNQNITIRVEGSSDPAITAQRIKEELMRMLGEK